EVAAVADAVPGADELQGPRAVQPVGALGQVEAAGGVVDVPVHGDGHPAYRVHQVLEAGEVDLDVVVHADPGHLLHRLDHAGRTDLGVDGVEHHAPRGGDRGTGRAGALGAGHQGVARDADCDGLPAALGYVHHQRGVRTGPGDLAGVQRRVGAGPGVR